MQLSWEAIGEWLLPRKWFRPGEYTEKQLTVGRLLVAIFYAALLGVFVYTVYWLSVSGRIEVMENVYKRDIIEAPSLAICPFNQNTSIRIPKGPDPVVKVIKYDLAGSRIVDATMHGCAYDRQCVCLDLSQLSFVDHLMRDTMYAGFNGVASKSPITFKERVEIITTLEDPSPDNTLKVGLYDSMDVTPDWVYVTEGRYIFCKLQLLMWTVTDFSVRGVEDTLNGDLSAMGKMRRLYSPIIQEAGSWKTERGTDTVQTSMSFEMNNFFVTETVSSETAFSFYTLAFLVFLIALRAVMVDAFLSFMFPLWEDPALGPKPREMSWMTQALTSMLCYCSNDDDDDDAEVRKPLKETP